MKARFGILLSLILAWAAAEGREEVSVPSLVKAGGFSSLTLAHILPEQIKDVELRKVFATYPLADSPRVGERRVLSHQLITTLLRRAKAEQAEVINKYNFRIPREVTFENPGAHLPDNEIKQGLLGQWKAQCPECRIEIQELSLPRLPEGSRVNEWSFVGAPPLPRGSFSIGIRVKDKSTGDSNGQRYWVNGVAKIHKKVPVVVRNMAFSERLAESDVTFEFRDVTYARDAVPAKEDLLGRKVKMTKAAGQILWQSDLAKEKAVSRGEWIKVSSTEGPLQISMMAQAESDGFVGDVVRLKGASSKQVITGVAVAKGSVELR